jgi:hypothetical protein
MYDIPMFKKSSGKNTVVFKWLWEVSWLSKKRKKYISG